MPNRAMLTASVATATEPPNDGDASGDAAPLSDDLLLARAALRWSVEAYCKYRGEKPLGLPSDWPYETLHNAFTSTKARARARAFDISCSGLALPGRTHSSFHRRAASARRPSPFFSSSFVSSSASSDLNLFVRVFCPAQLIVGVGDPEGALADAPLFVAIRGTSSATELVLDAKARACREVKHAPMPLPTQGNDMPEPRRMWHDDSAPAVCQLAAAHRAAGRRGRANSTCRIRTRSSPPNENRNGQLLLDGKHAARSMTRVTPRSSHAVASKSNGRGLALDAE